jgi:predicted nucleotidyltransferase
VTTEAGRRRRVTLSELRRRRAEVYAIAQRYGVSNIRVFGSVARADATLSQGEVCSISAGFISGTEEALEAHVDVTTVGGLRPRLRERVLPEAVAL